MENLTNLDSLPTRFNFIAIPLKIKKGTIISSFFKSGTHFINKAKQLIQY